VCRRLKLTEDAVLHFARDGDEVTFDDVALQENAGGFIPIVDKAGQVIMYPSHRVKNRHVVAIGKNDLTAK
jgi:hypothetical protein